MVIGGDAPDHSGNVLLTRAIFPLASLGFERLAYYTLTGSLVVFFEREMRMASVLSQQMQAVFQSLVNLFPIIGAFMADKYTGRFWMASICLLISSLGALFMTIASGYNIHWLFMVALFLLYTVPIAMVKSNTIVLGGDQFNSENPEQLKQRELYFGGTYWVTNIGAAISYIVLNQLAVEGMGSVSKDFGFTFCFICGTVFVFMAWAAITLPAKFLYAPKPQGSAMTVFFRVTGASLQNAPTQTGWWVIIGILGLFLMMIASIPTFFFDSKAANYTIAALMLVFCVIMIVAGRQCDWVRNAAVQKPDQFSEMEVEAAVDVYRLAPYIAFAIPFWAVYNQMNTAFMAQGCQMNNKVGSGRLSPSVMAAMDCVVIVILIPILNAFFFPCMKKIGGGKFTLTPLRRIGVGLLMSGVVMIIAAQLEVARRKAPILMTTCTKDNVTSGWCTQSQIGSTIPELSSCYTYVDDGDSKAHAPVPKRDMSIWIQIVSYGMTAFPETLVAVTYYDFFYSQVPPFMRSVCNASQMLCVAMGTMVGGVINNMCKTWLPDNLDDGHQEYMYYINAGFAWVALAVFIAISRTFEYKPGTSGFPWDEIDEDPADEIKEIQEEQSSSRSHVKSHASREPEKSHSEEV